MTKLDPNQRPDHENLQFYREAMRRFEEYQIPFLVGGAFAFHSYTGIDRRTRDFDVFIRPEDITRVIERFARDGYDASVVFPHWLGKVVKGDDYVDLIYGSGNGVAPVDSAWFEHSVRGEILGHHVRLVPIEEMIWQKAFIMERERFDGADVIHLIRAGAMTMDWDRLIARFGPHARVLLVHLILFGYVFPDERASIPDTVLQRLVGRLKDAPPESPDGSLCFGTVLSRSQYLPDLDRGYRDGRLIPEGTLSPDEIHIWTEAADEPRPRG